MGRRSRLKVQTQPGVGTSSQPPTEPAYPPGAAEFDESQKAQQYADRLRRGEIIPNNELITKVAPLKKKYPRIFGIQK